MRQLHVQLPATHLERVRQLAGEHGAAPLVALSIHPGAERHQNSRGGDAVLAVVDLPNRSVGAFVDAVRSEVDDALFVLLPVGTLPLVTPLEELHPRVQDVSRLSTLELVLSAVQSVGSWRGLLLYALLAGLIAAYGIVFDMSYLLVAAMLINPMGAPALVSVIGLSTGDGRIFARGTGRFAVALAVQAIAAMTFGFAYGVQVSTEMMEQVARLSLWAVAIAVAAGAAGAHTQVKSDRDSLISGTAAGFMVAAALAPPAAVLGLSIPLARWDYLGQMAFLLLLQYGSIAIGGWIVLSLLGVRPQDPSMGRGSPGVRNGLLVCLCLATIGLVVWQSQAGPSYRKADLVSEAVETARAAVRGVSGAGLIEVDARFTRADLQRYRSEVLLVNVLIEDLDEQGQTLEERTTIAVRDALQRELAGVVPLVNVQSLQQQQPESTP